MNTKLIEPLDASAVALDGEIKITVSGETFGLKRCYDADIDSGFWDISDSDGRYLGEIWTDSFDPNDENYKESPEFYEIIEEIVYNFL